ncbi:MAG: alpha-glucan family phosphorylase, partial [Prevotellaceae bacterium]|nr:alpha-glucan family phosphorylase [Prevotellaceae bacterium]
MQEKILKPDYLFEVSWEVCNKIGGIHTVLSSKVHALANELRNGHIFIGPDLMKENELNPEFKAEPQLMKSWCKEAAAEGLGVRIGRWNVKGKPLAILVDFSRFITQKDEIFARFWEDYKLDSISGQWDYIESALFGYAAGKVIESFVRFHVSSSENVVAHFHEWMSGAGLLHLRRNNPRIACVFTTHATVMGRCIAGNNLPLYDNLENFNAEVMSNDFNVRSRYSMEKVTAQAADIFTAVSDITARECKQFLNREPDVITPNGFDVYKGSEEHLGEGRAKMFAVAKTLLGTSISDDAVLIGTSGRYEFKNKGLDVFIRALGRLNQEGKSSKEIIAFIFVPAGQHGPSRELLHNLQNPNEQIAVNNRFCTHNLADPYADPVLKAIHDNGLRNLPENKVKIIFVPSYLKGKDEIFDMDYYDLLADLDMTVFLSYYEPWGYTPMESVAYEVPTVTSSLAGFGLWVSKTFEHHPGVEIVERNDSNDNKAVKSLVQIISNHCDANDKQIAERIENTKTIAEAATWDKFISNYKEAYSQAIAKASQRHIDRKATKPKTLSSYQADIPTEISPSWHQIIVQRTIPERLKPLDELSRNIWWSWNYDAIKLFKSISPEHWKKAEYNPILMLDMISFQRFRELEQDENFVAEMNRVYQTFCEYMREKRSIKSRTQIAYFSMEYGLHSSLKIYSGGLGILAGDYLKEASDKGVNIVGVGLLYRYGYFKQRLSAAGDQVAEYEAQTFDKIPVNPVRDKDGNWVSIEIALPGRILNAKIWRVDVGRTELYLLDTDVEDNIPEDRAVTYHLYGGDWENRLKQEILLGVGGIRALTKLGVEADVYHCNEGHAAMIGLERMHRLIWKHNLSFDEAREVVRASSLFTTHTPVPAGHDAFEEGLLRKYISHYPARFQVPWERIVGLGRMNPKNAGEKFSMSCLATNLSQEVNGVSWLHGKVTREMFCGMFPGYLPEELHIGHVTNGVHYPTWTAPVWKQIYSDTFGPEFSKHHYDKSCFKNIQNVDDQKIWDTRNLLRSKLVEHIKTWVGSQKDINYYSPREIVEIRETLDPTKLTIGFARRFATYKRAHLLFTNLEQLNGIVNHPAHPVQFIFAGKAHPADKAGQDLIKRIVEVSKYPQFLGKILFLENYDMELAAKMVRGVDIWLNTPTRPQEASGTSGEKAVMNGVMHFSVLDGWWVEGYKPGTGWALPIDPIYKNNDFQNELDAETIYSIIENEIAPLYYSRNENGIPEKWTAYVKNSIEKVASNFTTNRMMNDYEEQFY